MVAWRYGIYLLVFTFDILLEDKFHIYSIYLRATMSYSLFLGYLYCDGFIRI